MKLLAISLSLFVFYNPLERAQAMNWAVATGIVAVYGATLSTWKAVSDYFEKRRSITVKVSYGYETYGPGLDGLGPPAVVVTAMNTGHRTVSLRAAGIRLPDGRDTMYLRQSGDARFPHDLEGGQSCMICIPLQAVRGGLQQAGFSGRIRLTGYFRDALDKTYKSKRFKFDAK